MSTSRMSCVTSDSDGLHPNDRTTVPRSLVAILPSLSMSKREKHACASGKIGVFVKKIAHILSHFIFLSVIVTERHNYITCLLCPRRNQQFFFNAWKEEESNWTNLHYQFITISAQWDARVYLKFFSPKISKQRKWIDLHVIFLK